MTLLQMPKQDFRVGNQQFVFPEIVIQPNELVGLIGQTGSGKSILLRQLAGLMDTQAPLTFTGKRKAFIFSRGGLFQRHSILENLRLATLFTDLNTSNKDIEQVLQQWNLQSIQDKFPNQLNAQTNKIVQIVRAVVLQPDILFIEKPLVGLSPHQIEQFSAWIAEHVQNRGSVVYSEESTRTFHALQPRKIMLDGGHDNLRTVMHH